MYFCIHVRLEQVEDTTYLCYLILLIFKQLSLYLKSLFYRQKDQAGHMCSKWNNIHFYLFCLLDLHEIFCLNEKTGKKRFESHSTSAMLYINSQLELYHFYFQKRSLKFIENTVSKMQLGSKYSLGLKAIFQNMFLLLRFKLF